MVNVLNPPTVIVYGSANYKCFKIPADSGIQIVSFPSDTSLAFASKKEHLVLLDLYTHVHQDKFGGAKDSVFIKIANAEDLQFLL